MKVYTHLNQIVTLQGAAKKNGRNLHPDDLGIINDGAIAFDENEIHWVGTTSDLPEKFKSITPISLSGHILTPEIVDSHTHLVFAGDRSEEYAQRLNGTSYEEIAKRGGGILYTSKQTNHISTEDLFEKSLEKIQRIHSYGVGTIEIKSGYGLNFEKEYELSLLIHRLKQHFYPRIKIFNTFMAAHDVPKNYNSSSDYLDQVVLPLLKKLAPLNIIDAVDIFHEKNYFTDTDVEKLFSLCAELKIPTKMHADELNDNGGASLGVKNKSLSVDHLLKISDEGIKKLSQSDTVATILPGTAFFLGKPLAPARKLLDQGAIVALASDYNPGSCHCDNLLLVASISAPQLKINQAELWAGITLNAAKSLGIKNAGFLSQHAISRFSLFKVENLSHLTYHWGRNFNISLP